MLWPLLPAAAGPHKPLCHLLLLRLSPAQLVTVVCGCDSSALAAKSSDPLLAFQVEAVCAAHTGFAASRSLLHSRGSAASSHALWKLRVGEARAGWDVCPNSALDPKLTVDTEGCHVCWLSLVWSSWFPEGNRSQHPHDQGSSSLFQ